ncbi:unnamed protein product, partial [Rotaria sp. Silwood2]
MNHHVKTQHGKEYQEWLAQLNQSRNKDRENISDIFIKTNETARTSSFSKAFYDNNHPRQIQLSQSIVENLIIDLDLPLSIADRKAIKDKNYYFDCSTTREVNVTDDEQSTTPRSTPKRKSLFSNIERKSIKKQKIDNFAFIKDEITKYLNEDNSDSNR